MATRILSATPSTQDRIIRVVSISLAVIFYWFGIQKFFPNVSPAEEIASNTIYELTGHMVPLRTGLFLLACWEIILGVALLLIPRNRWVLWAAFGHLCGTFTTFVIYPGQIFGSATGSLTLLGQYVVKNLVLLAGLYTLAELERSSRAGERDAGPALHADRSRGEPRRPARASSRTATSARSESDRPGGWDDRPPSGWELPPWDDRAHHAPDDAPPWVTGPRTRAGAANGPASGRPRPGAGEAEALWDLGEPFWEDDRLGWSGRGARRS